MQELPKDVAMTNIALIPLGAEHEINQLWTLRTSIMVWICGQEPGTSPHNFQEFRCSVIGDAPVDLNALQTQMQTVKPLHVSAPPFSHHAACGMWSSTPTAASHPM